MAADVIQLPGREATTYTIRNGRIGVHNLSTGIELVNADRFYLCIGAEHVPFPSRKEAAQFMWMCARLLDSEGRYEFDEYAALDY